MAVKKTFWGNPEEPVYLFTISNGSMEVKVSNFGCTLVSIVYQDGSSPGENVILGYDSLREYQDDPFYTGSIIGRFAGRIANAEFTIDAKKHLLAANERASGNHLHGGNAGFNKKIFSCLPAQGGNKISFYHKSPHGEGGYPGNLEVFINYELTDKNELVIGYSASTDQATHVNLTSHCYFNLSGTAEPDATNQRLRINASRLLASGDNYLPTGKLKSLHGTKLDFTTERRIRNDETGFAGYNAYFALDEPGSELPVRADLSDPGSGRRMILKTTLPALVLYTGDFLRAPFLKNQGICLEAQFFPDTPNQPHLPTTLLRPGQRYEHKTIYQFR